MGKRIRHPKPPKLVVLPPKPKETFTHTADHVQLTYHPPVLKEEKDGQKV